MANIGDMVVRIVGDNSGLDKSIDNSSAKMEKFGSLATSVGKTLSLGLTAPIVAAGVAALKSAGDFQLYQASFETMLGSASKASKMIADMQKLAAATPFELSDLAEAGKTLLQFNVDAESILPTIQQIGDIAQGNGQKFASLSLAFGQMSSTGRLMGQDLLQMINAGFNPLLEISKMTGESMANLKKKMSDGAISADMVAEAFKHATSEGGQFFNGMEKASKTLPGLISTLRDDLSTMGRSFVVDLMPKVMETVKGLSSFAKMVTEMDPALKTFIVTMLAFAAAAGPVALGIGAISKALIFLAANPIVLAAAGVATLTAGFVSLIAAIEKANIEKIAKEYKSVADNIGLTNEEIARLVPLTNLLSNLNTTAEGTVSSFKALAFQTGLTAYELNQVVQANKDISQSTKDVISEYTKKVEAERKYEENKRASILKGEKDIADAKQKAIDDAKKKADAAALSEQQQIDARKKAAADYAKTIQENATKQNLGLLTSKQMYEENYEATKQYAEELIRLGYTGEAVNGVMNYGNTALAAAIEYMAKYKKEITDVNAAKEVALSLAQAETEVELKAYIFAQNFAKEKEAADKRIADAKKKQQQDEINGVFTIIDATLSISSSLVSIYDTLADEKIDAIERAKEKELSALKEVQDKEREILDERHEEQQDALDAALQEELYAKGFASAETIAQYEAELAAAQATGDAALIQKAKEALEEANIRKRFADQEKALAEQQQAESIALQKKQQKETAAIEKAAADERKQLMYESNLAQWNIQLAMATATVAQSVIQAYNSQLSLPIIGPISGAAAAAVAAAVGAAQLAAIVMAKPRLAQGAIIMPTAGGTDVTVGEAGVAEAVIPLDRLDSMLSKQNTVANPIEQMIHLVQNIDAKPILDLIFPATQNQTVLISGGAIV